MGVFDSTQQQSGSTRLNPYPGTMPGLGEAMGLVNRWVDQPLQFYPGQTYAPQTESELAAIQGLKDAAGGYGDMLGGVMDPAMAAYTSALGAPADVFGMNLQDVASNPYLADVASGIQSRVNRNLSENILPGLTLAGVGAGGPGGSRQGVAEGIAARGTSDVLAEKLANMYGRAWSQGLGAETARLGQAMSARQGALGMAPAMAGLGELGLTRPSELNLQAGTMERTEAQRAIDEDMARFNFAQNEPLLRGSTGLQTLMPAAMAFGEKETETETTSSPSDFAKLGGSLMLGGGLAGGLFGQGGMFPGAFGLYGGAPAAGAAGGLVSPYGGGMGMYNNPWTYGGYGGWY